MHAHARIHINACACDIQLLWERARDRVLEATGPMRRGCRGRDLIVCALLGDLDHGVSGDEDLGADSAETQALACADDDTPQATFHMLADDGAVEP